MVCGFGKGWGRLLDTEGVVFVGRGFGDGCLERGKRSLEGEQAVDTIKGPVGKCRGWGEGLCMGGPGILGKEERFGVG